MRARDDPLAAFLAGRDAPCPRCRYNLRGVADPSCPECGFTVSVPLLETAAATRTLRRACWAGLAYSGAVIAMVALVFRFAIRSDPLAGVCLWLAAAFAGAWLCLALLWALTTRPARVPGRFIVQLFTGLSWSIATVLLLVIFVLLLIGL